MDSYSHDHLIILNDLLIEVYEFSLEKYSFELMKTAKLPFKENYIQNIW